MILKTKKYLWIKALVIAAALLAGASVCDAREWFVRASGGSGDGSSYASAWAGFGAINWGSVAPGDTLYICGTFNSTLNVGASGSGESSRVAVRGDYAQEGGVIDVSGGEAISVYGRSFVTLQGITVDRSGTNGVGAQSSSYVNISNCNFYRVGQSGGTVFGIDGRYAQGMKITNCRLTNEKGAFNATGITVNLGMSSPARSYVDKCYINGIEVDGICPGNNVTITRNTIGNLMSAASHADGIPVQGSNVIVSQNTIYNCTQNIYVDSFDYGSGSQCICDNVVVADNLVYGTSAIYGVGTNGISVDVETSGAASIRNLKIYNNTVANLNYRGFAIGDRGNGASRLDGLDIRNNIVANCGDWNTNFDFDISGRPANMIMDYNLALNNHYENNGPNYSWNGTRYTLVQFKSAFGVETHGVSNPSSAIFVKYSYGASDNDYRPASGSPAINAGISAGDTYNIDLAGTSRPQGSGWDMGCYEEAGGSAGTPGGTTGGITVPTNHSDNGPNPPKNLRII
jgi:hypothetical protein